MRKGLTSGISDCIGEGNPEKTGGVDCPAKKDACEREPLRALQGAQHAIRFSMSCVPPLALGIIWSTCVASAPQY